MAPIDVADFFARVSAQTAIWRNGAVILAAGKLWSHVHLLRVAWVRALRAAVMRRSGAKRKFRFAVLFVGVVAGCGYPIDPDKWIPDFGIDGDHGAIALNDVEMNGAITARFLSQDEADSKALSLCGKGCAIILRFEGGNACGALAVAPNKHYGVADGHNKGATESAAMDECRQIGGTDCEIQLSACN